MKKRRIFGLLLVGAMVLSSLQFAMAETGTAEGKLVDSSQLKNGDIIIGKAEHAYGGGKKDVAPIEWRVLDNAKTNMGTPGMLLISEYILTPPFVFGSKNFGKRPGEGEDDIGPYYRDEAGTIWGNEYTGSKLNNWCRTFAEETLGKSPYADRLIATTKKDPGMLYDWGAGFPFAFLKDKEEDPEASHLVGQKAFAISGPEAVDPAYFPLGPDERNLAPYDFGKAVRKATGAYMNWWLRSPALQRADDGRGVRAAYIASTGIPGTWMLHVGAGIPVHVPQLTCGATVSSSSRSGNAATRSWKAEP